MEHRLLEHQGDVSEGTDNRLSVLVELRAGLLSVLIDYYAKSAIFRGFYAKFTLTAHHYWNIRHRWM